MTESADYTRRMVDDLSESGELAPEWRDSFLSVPRHAFIPDVVWRRDLNIRDDNDLVPLQRANDPETWLELAYEPRKPVITQVDDGCPAGPGRSGCSMTSSASQPNVVALMLAALNVAPGMTVCEIGTGTGYNAALLAHRLGARNVITIEVDPQIAAQARQALVHAGYHNVITVTGDGSYGYPSCAPYDRVLATCAAYRVPYQWIAQTRPGGQVVTPWETPYGAGGLLSLKVSDDGTATGGIVDNVAFMCLRDQRPPRASLRGSVYDRDKASITHTDLHPAYATNFDPAVAVALRVPQCTKVRCSPIDNSGGFTLWFLDPLSRSWAKIDYEPGADLYQVDQLGPRRLWDEVEAACRWWLHAGSPKAEQWKFTVTPEGQNIELVP
ncbi:MAG: methyltransferase domain-containing protein [Pseudonocardiaceae bacterium]